MDSVKVLEKISGKVEQVSDKNGRYGLKINGVWYNGSGAPPVIEGDTISFEFEEVPDRFDASKSWRNIRKLIDVAETGLAIRPADQMLKEAKPSPELSKERIYVDIMKCAVDIVLKRSTSNGVPTCTQEVDATFVKLCQMTGVRLPL